MIHLIRERSDIQRQSSMEMKDLVEAKKAARKP